MTMKLQSWIFQTQETPGPGPVWESSVRRAMFIASSRQEDQAPSGAACLGDKALAVHMPLLTELERSFGVARFYKHIGPHGASSCATGFATTGPAYRALSPRVFCLVMLLILCFLFASSLHAAARREPSPISTGPDGRLSYAADAQGNRVPDFSFCGYAEGDRPIPDAPVRVVVRPIAGDSTARIQKAIDYVSSLPLDTNGLRGAVLLLRGRYEIFGGLRLDASGVVLRGQAMDEGGTVLVAAGKDRRTLIRILGRNDCANPAGKSWQIKDDYVPVGAMSFLLEDASGLKPGDTIRVIRPSLD